MILVVGFALLLVLGFSSPVVAQPIDPNQVSSLGVSFDVASGTVEIDTDATPPEMSGAFSVTGVVQNGLAVFCFDSVDVAAGVVVRPLGSRPVVILSRDTLTFAGELDASAVDSEAGPGGFDGAVVGGMGEGPGAGMGTPSGASGAGHGGVGGDVSNATGGGTYGDLTAALEGGSGGGMGTLVFFGVQGNGGGGGGAVQLAAVNDVIISGSIHADGAAGESDPDHGGGGGSGGAILIHSVDGILEMGSGTISARGGDGGTGQSLGGGGGGGGRILLQGLGVNATNVTADGGDPGNNTTTGDPGGTGVITVNVFNRAPILDNSGDPYLNDDYGGVLPVEDTTVTELLSRGAGGNPITDLNPGDPRGIALVGADTTHGTWEFSVDGGTNWTPITSTLSNSNALLLEDSDDARLRLIVTSGFAGIIPSAITFRAWDHYEGSNGTFYDIAANGGTGGTNAFSDATETARLEIIGIPKLVVSRDATAITVGGTDDLGTNWTAGVAADVGYTLENTGTGTLNLTGTDLVAIQATTNADVFLVVVPATDQLAAGTDVTFVLQVRPLSPGPFSVEVLIESDDWDTPNFDFTLSGMTSTAPSIALAYQVRRIVHNGEIPVGTASTEVARVLSFTVHNHGIDELSGVEVSLGERVRVEAQVFSQPAGPVAGSDSETFEIEVQATNAGAFRFFVEVESNDPTTPSFRFLVTGLALDHAEPLLQVERLPGVALEHDTADPVGHVADGAATPLTWRLINVGFGELVFSTHGIINAVNCTASFTLAPPTTPLAPLAETPITVEVEPTTAGAFSFEITLITNSIVHPVRKLIVSGTATATNEGLLQFFGPSHTLLAPGANTTLPRHHQDNIASSYTFVLVNHGLADVDVDIPVILANAVNSQSTIPDQPAPVPTLTLQPRAFAHVHISMLPEDESQPAGFTLQISSNAPNAPSYSIVATTPGPVPTITQGTKKESACGMAPSGGALWLLLQLLALLPMLALRRNQASPNAV